VEVSRFKVSQSGLKTGGEAAQMVHIASSRRFHRVEAEDGRVNMMDCIEPFYLNFTIFVGPSPQLYHFIVVDMMNLLIFDSLTTIFYVHFCMQYIYNRT
jgi:hypothetical protein